MDTKLATMQYRLSEWTRIIQDRSESGLKVDDYCQEHGISKNAYYYWLRKVKAQAIVSAQESFVEVTDIQRNIVIDKNEQFKPQITISLGDVVINIDSNTPTDLIKKVFEVISNA